MCLPSLFPFFPYTTLFRSLSSAFNGGFNFNLGGQYSHAIIQAQQQHKVDFLKTKARFNYQFTDRKSTRLNSSHVAISYAVFCLKKKKENIRYINTYRIST